MHRGARAKSIAGVGALGRIWPPSSMLLVGSAADVFSLPARSRDARLRVWSEPSVNFRGASSRMDWNGGARARKISRKGRERFKAVGCGRNFGLLGARSGVGCANSPCCEYGSIMRADVRAGGGKRAYFVSFRYWRRTSILQTSRERPAYAAISVSDAEAFWYLVKYIRSSACTSRNNAFVHRKVLRPSSFAAGSTMLRVPSPTDWCRMRMEALEVAKPTAVPKSMHSNLTDI
mmetsp:Transcript_670/g.1739  ORF Transcript_670/g.1739 Transcript_670/m.1739 type:complete len:233 (-) Transcript_670:866-1564(-)